MWLAQSNLSAKNGQPTPRQTASRGASTTSTKSASNNNNDNNNSAALLREQYASPNRAFTGPIRYTPSVRHDLCAVNTDCVKQGSTVILLCAGSPDLDDNQMMTVNPYDKHGELGSFDRYNAAAAVVDKASKFVVVGGSDKKVRAMKQFLIDHGASPSAVRALDCSAAGANSRGNMAALSDALSTDEYKRDNFVLLTSYFHLPRAILFARYSFDADIRERLTFASADHIVQGKSQPQMPVLQDVPVVEEVLTTKLHHSFDAQGRSHERLEKRIELQRRQVPPELTAMLYDALSMHTERMATRYASELKGLNDWAQGRYGPGSGRRL